MNQCGQALGKIKYVFEKLKTEKSSKNDSKKTPTRLKASMFGRLQRGMYYW